MASQLSDGALKALEKSLATASYLDGHFPTAKDAKQFKLVPAGLDATKFPNVARWWTHISSFSPEAQAKWPGAEQEKKKPEKKQEKEKKAAPKAEGKKKKKVEDSEETKALKARREEFELVMLRRFFYVPAFEIYGGVGGLFDYGPCGCSIMTNMLQIWRQHFVLNEDMLEISGTCLTPEAVLKTSGHVDRFTDYMCKDEVTGDPVRADKRIEEVMDELLDQNPDEKTRAELLAVKTKAGAMGPEDLQTTIDKYEIKSPAGNDLTEPYAFNLMFSTQIGPTGKFTGYMRPETAQGIFVNFKRLLDFNGGQMPFACAQIGLAFRNEIAPRSGLLRVREFPMAEIEHFVNPQDKRHPKFKDVAEIELSLLSRELQTGEDIPMRMKVGEAVRKGVINNETLAYFMARTHLFMRTCGLEEKKIRFRQHKSTEMAHYAKDCWDCEIHNSYGWIECVGHADRACYDLDAHAKAAKVELTALETFDKPREVEEIQIKPDRAIVGKTFGDKQKALVECLKDMEKDRKAADSLKQELETKGKATVTDCNKNQFEITSAMVKISTNKKTVQGVRFTPSVIEPSFGLGRIIYSILENSYYVRPKKDANNPDEAERAVLRLSPRIAPLKCSIFPLTRDDQLIELAHSIVKSFVEVSISSKADATGASIGKRYARTDEIGVPFAITVDPATFQGDKKTVTIRERDSTAQVRVPLDEAVAVVASLVQGKRVWADIQAKYPKFETNADDDDKDDKPAKKNDSSDKKDTPAKKEKKDDKPKKEEKPKEQQEKPKSAKKEGGGNKKESAKKP